MDAGCLAEIFGHLTDVGICRARCVCTAWRDAAQMAGVWRAAFQTMFGEHSARWANLHEPVTVAEGDDEWRVRCSLRRQAAANRVAGLARCRLLPFEMGPTPNTSPFYIASIALDGPWLALGEHRGCISLWDLRTGKQKWRTHFGQTGQSVVFLEAVI